eukprot:TRINITY_DN76279_c0_g1_i1.p1 TRINITY_DN76279_c0_g1~~TRINITY_DN76279_c0_g1_i1.p1  ORF type:complete len:308 (+),score=9.20 TRINITY_DN76279_c0_g1_i1:39-962(+)
MAVPRGPPGPPRTATSPIRGGPPLSPRGGPPRGPVIGGPRGAYPPGRAPVGGGYAAPGGVGPGGAFLDLIIDNQVPQGGPLIVIPDRAQLFDPKERRPDPYVEVRVGGDTERTRKARNSNMPVWGEQLVFPRARPQDVMLVTVKDSDFGRDDRMGNANIPLSTLPPGQSRKRVPLQGIDNTGRRAPVLGPGGGYVGRGYGPPRPVGPPPRPRMPPGMPATNYWLEQDPWQGVTTSPGMRPPSPPPPPHPHPSPPPQRPPMSWNGYAMDGDWDLQRKFDSWYSSHPIAPDPLRASGGPTGLMQPGPLF